MSSLWAFIKSRTFLLNVLGAIIFYTAFIFLFAFGIESYTQHGEEIKVPDVRGMSLSQANKAIQGKTLELKVVDSIYDGTKPSFMIIDQNPRPDSKVKEYRTIYLTINAHTPPQVKMPDLKDASLKQATMILESYGMKVGDLIYKPDLADNVVLDQKYAGAHIEPGTMIQKGATIDLVVGNGMGQTAVDIPNLIGLSLREAEFVLKGSSLNLGSVVADNTVSNDTLDAIVYQQAPPADDPQKTTVNTGDAIDVFVTSENHFKKEQKNPD